MASKVSGPGGYNAICDVCGFKYKASELRQRWDGMMVCKEDWETRHPQDFLRVHPDQHPLPFVRPEPDGIDVSPTYIVARSCPVGSNVGVIGAGIVGCMVVGKGNP